MGVVVSVSQKMTKIQKLKHYLFDCPTFWRIKPAFKCPICGATFRCYWDGGDIGGHNDVCCKCYDDMKSRGIE
jgi:hypothetical protein